jgi:prepilin-type N-terminal cleavage/methylation domain-containing protein
MTKIKGFTLAEVLITLGIIGVVAAMTMPTLINSTNGAQFKVAYKKALSVLNQAVALNMALDDYDFSGTSASGTAATADTAVSVYNIIKKRMNVVRTSTAGLGYEIKADTAATGATAVTATIASNASNYQAYFFNDGIAFIHQDTAASCSKTSPCYGFIDVNGQKGPNKQTVCKTSTSGDTCEVDAPADIYPVEFYAGTLTPANDAAKAVLYGK